MLSKSGLDDRLVMPAWQRYDGRLFRAAQDTLAGTDATGRTLIISGGYGVVRADEPIGWYDKPLQLRDWPDGVLEAALTGEVRRVGVPGVVAFLAGTSQYARLFGESAGATLVWPCCW